MKTFAPKRTMTMLHDIADKIGSALAALVVYLFFHCTHLDRLFK